MRNFRFSDGLEHERPNAPGLSRDAFRTDCAMRSLAQNLGESLELGLTGIDEAEVIDRGLRELARRFAWQAAAAFAKRIPHGTLSCSNIALSGAYIDYGLSNHVPAYRRHAWPSHWLDPWSEHLALAQTLVSLRHQIEKYHPNIREAGIVSAQNLIDAFLFHFQQREVVEMAKMGGLTEDLALACPVGVLATWGRVMKAIWKSGADEPFLTQYEGNMKDGGTCPAPRATGDYDLSSIFRIAGNATNEQYMDRMLSNELSNERLRVAFVSSTMEVRRWFRAWASSSEEQVDAFIAMQVDRKNGSLECLRRAPNGSHAIFEGIESLVAEADQVVEAAAACIDSMLKRIWFVLPDLAPSVPGRTGAEQLINMIVPSG
jgi:hypothetical protein